MYIEPFEYQWDEPSQTPHKYKSAEYVHIGTCCCRSVARMPASRDFVHDKILYRTCARDNLKSIGPFIVVVFVVVIHK